MFAGHGARQTLHAVIHMFDGMAVPLQGIDDMPCNFPVILHQQQLQVIVSVSICTLPGNL
jgi:hypothetical protein